MNCIIILLNSSRTSKLIVRPLNPGGFKSIGSDRIWARNDRQPNAAQVLCQKSTFSDSSCIRLAFLSSRKRSATGWAFCSRIPPPMCSGKTVKEETAFKPKFQTRRNRIALALNRIAFWRYLPSTCVESVRRTCAAIWASFFRSSPSTRAGFW